MDSITATGSSEAINKVLPLLEEGRYGEALPFLELQKSKSSDPVWHYLTALTLACQDRGNEGVALLEKVRQSPGFDSAFDLSEEVAALTRTAALNHLLFETTVDENAIGPWQVLAKYAELLKHRDSQVKAATGLLKLEPESAENIQRFSALYKDESVDEAIRTLESIINSKPSASRPRTLLGALLQKKGKTALAIRYFKTALDSDRNAVEPHICLGKIYVSQARYEEAEKEFFEAIDKSKPTAALLVEIANCQQATYRYDDSLNTLFQALELDTPGFEYWDQLLNSASYTGRTAELIEVMREAISKHADSPELRKQYALIVFNSGDPLAAKAQLQELGAFNSNLLGPSLARLAIEVALELEEYEAAISAARCLYDTDPQNPESNKIYGDCLIACGQTLEAENLLRDAARRNPNDERLQIAWGRALLALEDYERAHQAFSLASRLDPDDAEAMAEQGHAMVPLGLHEEALNVLKESAKKIDPPLTTTLNGLGAVYEHKKLYDAAADFYSQALEKSPSSVEAACGFVRTLATNDIADLTPKTTSLSEKLSNKFSQLKLLVTIFKATFIESTPEQALRLKEQIFPNILKDATEEYQAFFKKIEVQTLKNLAQGFEKSSQPEKARNVWRYVLNTPVEELAPQAALELKKLDTFENLPAVTTDSATKTTKATDELSSILSETIPPAADERSNLEVELFAEESEPAASTVSPEDVPLFADEEQALDKIKPAGSKVEDDVLSALFAADIPSMEPARKEKKEEEFPPRVEDPISLLLASTTPPLPAAPSTGDPEVDSAPEVEAPIAPILEQEPEAEQANLGQTPEQPALTAPTPEPAKPELTKQEDITPSTPGTPQAHSALTQPVEDDPLASTASLEEESTLFPAPPVATAETLTQDTHEELLPIPMPVDFSPLTRRQLHYHEMLISSSQGVVNPESIAHMLMQTTSASEPPDPGSIDAQGGISLLQQALLSSAIELEGSQQFKLAARVLRTALLYQPQEVEVLEALARVQLHWSEWLSDNEEFAYAVNLLRDILQRSPQDSQAEEQLKSTYHSWMEWCLANGDPAARDLLAVYLDQEQLAIRELKEDWEAQKKRLAGAPKPELAKPSPAPVKPSSPPREIAALVAEGAEHPQDSSPSAAPESTGSNQKASSNAPAPADPASQVSDTTVNSPSQPAAPPTSAAEHPASSAKKETSSEEPAPTVHTDLESSTPQATSAASPDKGSTPPANLDPSPKPASGQFSSKGEAIEALSAALEDDSVIDSVFSLFSSSMRELTTIFKDKANSSPDQPTWLLLLARAYRKSGSETMAVIQYQKYIKLHPTRDAYEELAQTYEELGKEDFAKMTRRKAEKV